MYDSFGRHIKYLRISLTDRCNLRCHYCLPEEGLVLRPRTEMLSFDEIVAVVQAGSVLGIEKIRLTGGEPLLRQGIAELVERLAQVPGISDLALTTNGQLLPECAHQLQQAGLRRVNVSLDTLDAQEYAAVTRGGVLNRVLEGLRAADAAGLSPIKLNCVVVRSADEPSARAVAQYARAHGYGVRFIRRMNLQRGVFWKVDGGDGGDCHACDRLRLSSDGYLYPCLFNKVCLSVREFGPEESLRRAIAVKPPCGTSSPFETLAAIGG